MNAVDVAMCLVAAYGPWVDDPPNTERRDRRQRYHDVNQLQIPTITSATIAPTWDVRFGYEDATGGTIIPTLPRYWNM